MSKPICCGYKRDKKLKSDVRCAFLAKNGKYCGKHTYFADYTWNDITDLSYCLKHNRYFVDKCNKCFILYNSAKHKESYTKKNKKRSLARKTCLWYQKGPVKDRRELCKNKNWKKCNIKVIDGTDYCKNHQYVAEYTDEMKQKYNLFNCSDCGRVMCIKNNTCSDCRNRGAKNRSISRKNKVICKIDKCTFAARSNGFCGNHQREYKKRQIEKDNTKKVCPNYVRGCKNILEYTSENSRCYDCRKYERENTNKYLYYIKQAKKRKIEFDIDEEYINTITLEPCFYCSDMADRKWNGLDRIDNNGAYSKKNVVPCCPDCNKMKKNYNVKDFLTYCVKIHNNWGCEDKSDKVLRRSSYKIYATGAKKRNYEFSLSKQEFNKILSNKCYYCANLINIGQIGIDRIDSDGHYTIDNCVACCKICNVMKSDFDINYFKDKIEKINIQIKEKDMMKGIKYNIKKIDTVTE